TSVDWSEYGPDGPIAGQPTRFQVYNWEKALLASGSIPAGAFKDGRSGESGTSDFARPMCYKGSTAATQQTPDRRTITALVVNCDGPPQVKGKTSGVKVVAGLDLFLVAPVTDHGASSARMFGEVIARTSNTSEVGKVTRKFSVRLYE